jgi:hypothetical protein
MGHMDKCTHLSLLTCGRLYTARFNFSEELFVVATMRESVNGSQIEVKQL